MPFRPPPIRRTLLVKPSFQLGMVVTANLMTLAVLVVFGMVVLHFNHQVQAFGALHGMDPSHPLQVFLRERQRGVLAALGVVGIVAVIVISIGTVVITHRIAGPLHRLQSHLDQVAEGKASGDVHFRPRDWFPELAVSCNCALKALRAKQR